VAKAQTRDQIRVAAWDLFTSKGFDATTTQAIAKRARVATGTVFLHASDKADLLFLVMHDRLADVVEERLASVPRGKLVDRVMHVFSGLFAMYGEIPDVAAAFVKHLPGARGPNAQRMWTMTFGFVQRIGMLVAEGQSTGEIARDVEPVAAAQNNYALYFASLTSWLNGHVTREAAHDPLLRNALDLQMRGLRA
jgi:AcrR family transcriptional regulator